MSTSGRRVLVLTAVVVALAGAALLWLGVRGLSAEPDVQLGAAVQEGTVAAGPDGFSLWSTDASAFEVAVCTAEGTTLLRPVANYSITVDGTTYHELARSPRTMAEGEHAVSCEPAQEFLAGPRATTTARTGIQGTTGVLVGAGLLVLALVLAAWAAVAHVRRRRLESFRVPASRLDPGRPQPRDPEQR